MDIKKAREIANNIISNINIDEYIVCIENRINDNALKGLFMIVVCTKNLIPCEVQRSAAFPKIIEHFKEKGFKICDRDPVIKIEWK